MQSMNNNMSKVLMMVEGEETEYDFFNTIRKRFGLSIEIVPVKGNVYELYCYMRKHNFEVNIIDAIRDIIGKKDKEEYEKNNKIFNDKYAYYYLIYDFDIHHKNSDDIYKEDNEVIERNVFIVGEMLQYFNNETDDTIGKLYINYPMMESYRDIKSFYDEEYNNKCIKVEQSKKYKDEVAKRKIAGLQLSRYTKENFLSILRLNINKVGYINNCIINKKNYLSCCDGFNIFNIIKNKMFDEKIIVVLNTSIMLLSDYRYQYYEESMKLT